MKKLLFLVFLLVTHRAVSQSSKVPIIPLIEQNRSVFLIGDTGELGAEGIVNGLQEQVKRAGRESIIIFLGDNIYPRGLPPVDAPGRKLAETILKTQLDAVNDLTDHIYVIPGNHDWQKGGKQGWRYALQQEAFVQQHHATFLPKGGCPGPVEVVLDSTLTLIVLNTQWFLHPWSKPAMGGPQDNSDCTCSSGTDVLEAMETLLQRNAQKRVLVVGHHPLWSNGEHGGHFTVKDHLFPLTALKSWLWLPLPGLGSIYPIYRQTQGSLQDVSHPVYRLWAEALAGLLRRYPNTLYASGHDHNLQVLRQGPTLQIVSGAGAKTEPVSQGGKAIYATARRGFVQLTVNPTGPTGIDIWAEVGDRMKIVFQQELPMVQFGKNRSQPTSMPTSNQVVEATSGDPTLRAGRVKEVIWGKNYRDLWQAPINAPLLWISQRGLKPQILGGGLQTLSLRLADSIGRVYVLRQIRKYPEKAIPSAIRSHFIEDIVKDQISGSHPYGLLAIPKLAQAAGLPYTHPQLVVVANDPALGEYRALFANSLAVLEEHVQTASADLLGNSWPSQPDQIISTSNLLRKLYADSDNQVDSRELLRARLFDMWIGDWDRHDDQWKWAGFSTSMGWRYEAIPRDRDQAFFRANGITRTFSRKWLLPKLEGFRPTIHYVPGLNTSGIPIDRTFLTGLSWADWQLVTSELQRNLTDSVIALAVADLPKPAYQTTGATIINNLRQRRNDWLTYGRDHYRFLAKTPDVVGSNQPERFTIERLPDGRTRVTAWRLHAGKTEKAPFFTREFLPNETTEIRVYGLGGKDQFIVSGHGERGIRVRLIGGDGEDHFIDSSSVATGRRHTLVYDLADSTTHLLNGPQTVDRTSRYADVNNYERVTIRGDVAAQLTAIFNTWQPLLSLNANPDDGLLLGGGVLYRKHGFRKSPFASQQHVSANAAISTGAFNFSYRGVFTDVLRLTDLRVRADLMAPNFVRNFFGYGNETPLAYPDNIRYYRARFQSYTLETMLVRKFRRRNEVYAGILAQRARLLSRSDKFTDELASSGQLPPDAFATKWYAGGRIGWSFDSRNDAILPTRGATFRTDYTALKGLNAQSHEYEFVLASFAWWLSANPKARLVLANRTGLEHALNDHYEVFQAATLGGLSNLRGYRRYRFSGRTALYNNTDLRLRVTTIRTYLFPAPVGLLGYYDIGRVWQPGETSDQWHQSAGVGAWIAPFGRSVVSFQYTFSNEGALPILRTGFLF